MNLRAEPYRACYTGSCTHAEPIPSDFQVEFMITINPQPRLQM